MSMYSPDTRYTMIKGALGTASSLVPSCLPCLPLCGYTHNIEILDFMRSITNFALEGLSLKIYL